MTAEPAAPPSAAPSLPSPTATAAPFSPPQSAATPPPGQFSPYDAIFAAHAPPALANNPEFLSIVAAGTLAESSWDPSNTTGDGGHSWGLFQMHDAGAGSGMGNARLDPNAASAVMVPKYAQAYMQIKAQNPGLSGAPLAARVAQAAERSADETGGAYAAAYNRIMGGNAPAVTTGGPTTTGQPQMTSGMPSDFTAPTPNTATTNLSQPTTTSSNPLEDFTSHVQQVTGGAISTLGSGMSSMGSGLQDFASHVKQATGGLVDLTGGSIQTLGSPGAPTPSDSLTNPPLQQPLPPPPPATPSPPPPPEPSMWDKLGQGIASVFSNVFGGNGDFAGGPSSPIGARVLQRNAEGGLNPGDVMQAESTAAQGVGNAIYGASPGLQEASRLTGTSLQTPADMATTAQGFGGTGVSGLSANRNAPRAIGQPDQPTVAQNVAAAGVQGYMGAAGSALTGAGNPLGFLIDPQGQLTPLAALGRGAGAAARDLSGVQGALGEAAPLARDATDFRLPGMAGSAVDTGMGATGPGDAGNGPQPLAGLIPNANRARATAADRAAAAEGLPTRDARLAANDVYGGAEPPLPGEQFTRNPQGDIVPVPQEQNLTSLLQAMIDQAKAEGRGSPQLVQALEDAKQHDLYGPTELNAGLNPGQVASAARNVGTNIRTGFNPASAAPQAVQDALNTLDGTTREAQSVTQRAVLQGQVTAQQGQQLAGQVKAAATKQFLQDVAASPDGVAPIVQGIAPPSGWSSGGKLSPALAGVWLSPETATTVRNTLNTDVTVPGLDGLARLSGAVKQVGLTGSPFHFIQEELQAVRLGTSQGNLPGAGQMVARSTTNAANPAAFKQWLTSPAIASVADRAARAGVTLSGTAGEGADFTAGLKGMAIRGAIGATGAGVSTYGVQRARGVPEDQALQQAGEAAVLGGVAAGPLGSLIGPAIFDRQIPTLKILGFKMLADSGMADADAAQMVNNTFGGQNLTRMARDPNLQAIMRSVVLAPDWWESWARGVGSAIPGMPVSQAAGDAARKYVATTVVSSAVTLEGLNYLLTGHFTNDNQATHTLDLEIPADKIPGAPASSQGGMVHIDILGPIKPMAEMVVSGDVGNFARSRLSNPAGLVFNAVKNDNPATGGQLVAPGTPPLEAGARYAGYELGQTAPAASSSLLRTYQTTGPVGGLAATASGARITESPGDPVTHPVTAEINRLNAAGYKSVSLPYPQKSFVYNSSTISLSADERAQVAKLRGDLVTQRLGPVVTSPAWQKLSDDQKANRVALIVSRSTSDAEHQFLGNLTAGDRSQRVVAGREVRGKLVNPPAQTSPVPSFLAPIRR